MEAYYKLVAINDHPKGRTSHHPRIAFPFRYIIIKEYVYIGIYPQMFSWSPHIPPFSYLIGSKYDLSTIDCGNGKVLKHVERCVPHRRRSCRCWPSPPPRVKLRLANSSCRVWQMSFSVISWKLPSILGVLQRNSNSSSFSGMRKIITIRLQARSFRIMQVSYHL